MVMGIVLILRVVNLSSAVLALLAGACVGEALNLEQRVNAGANAVMGSSWEAARRTKASWPRSAPLWCCSAAGAPDGSGR